MLGSQIQRQAESADQDFATYHEEPFNKSILSRAGYAIIHIGDRLGPQKQHEVIRKLGWGMFSTTWLARDHAENRYVVIKCLTAYGTVLHEGRIPTYATHEVAIMRRVSQPTASQGAQCCLRLLDVFTEHRNAQLDPFCYRAVPHSPDIHPHLCIVTRVAGQTLQVFRKEEYPGPGLPIVHAKQAVREILLGLDYLHRECRVVHTDIKFDNILVGYTPELTDWIIRKTQEYGPYRTYEGEKVCGDDDPTVGSDLLRLPKRGILSVFDVDIKIADFGCAQWIDQIDNKRVQPIGLRAPEVALGCPWNEKVDIWTIGCLTFQLLVAIILVTAEDGSNWSYEDEALWIIIQLKGVETYPVHLLRNARRADRFFSKDGRLRAVPTTTRLAKSLPQALAYNKLAPINAEGSPGEFTQALNFIERCLTLDPNDRPSAAELLQDPWLQFKPPPSRWAKKV